MRASLSVSLLPGLTVRSPFGIASSHLTGDERAIAQALRTGPAFITLKSVSDRFGGDGKGQRRYQRLDAIGLPSDFLADGPRTLELLHTERAVSLIRFTVQNGGDIPVGASVLAEEAYDAIVPTLEAAGAGFFELNFKYFMRKDGAFGASPLPSRTYSEMIKEECAAFRRATKRPLLVKLARDAAANTAQAFLIELSQSLAPLGFIVANAPRRALIGTENGAPHLYWGAQSGASLLPQTLALIAEFGRLPSDLALVASGGILSPEAAFACIALGARGIQLCSAMNFHGLDTVALFETELANLLERSGKASLDELIGAHRGAIDASPGGIPLKT